MKRRKFLTGGAVAGATIAAAGLPAPAIAQGKRRLKMVLSWPKQLPGLGLAAQRAAENINTLTDGQLDIRVYGAGELVPPFGVFDAVASGAAEMYHSASFLFQGKSKAFNFFTTVPFGLTSAEMMGWLYYGGGDRLWDQLSADYKIKPFAAGTAGVQMFGWLSKEINGLDDLKGLKYRIPGIGGEVLRRLGVAVTNIPASEIMAAFQSGAIDGTEWASPFLDVGLGFHKVAKYYYYPGFHEPGTTIELGVNLDVWKSLTAQQQAAIRVTCQSEMMLLRGEFAARNGSALKTLVEKEGVQLRRLPDDVLKAAGEQSKAVLAELAGADAMTKKVYDNYVAYKEQAAYWTRHSEAAYLDARRKTD